VAADEDLRDDERVELCVVLVDGPHRERRVAEQPYLDVLEARVAAVLAADTGRVAARAGAVVGQPWAVRLAAEERLAVWAAGVGVGSAVERRPTTARHHVARAFAVRPGASADE